MENITNEVDMVEDPKVNILVVSCVLLEMALSFLGILTNLLGKLTAKIKPQFAEYYYPSQVPED